MPQNCFWQFTVICIERTKIKKKSPGITDYWKKCQCSNHFLTGSHENKLWGSLTSWPNAINTFFCFHLFDGNKCAPFCFDSSGNSTQSGPCKRLLNYSHFYNLSISLRTLYFSNNLEVIGIGFFNLCKNAGLLRILQQTAWQQRELALDLHL